MRVVLDVTRTAEGHLRGVVRRPDAADVPFAGVLDLLRVLEEIDLGRPPDPDPDTPDRRHGDA